MLHEVKAEIAELLTNPAFARNLSLTIIIAIASLCRLGELQRQNSHLHVAHSLSIKVTEVIINRY
jgi:hypothetical protein